MSEGMKQLIKDLNEGENISINDVNSIVIKYHLSTYEKKLLKSKNEEDLKQLGLKKQHTQIVLSYGHSCLCGPHTKPTYIVGNEKNKE